MSRARIIPAGFPIGSRVETILTDAQQARCRASDAEKARQTGHAHFMGCAAAYMHRDEAYVVVGFTARGGLRLRGFAPAVSPRDVRISTKEPVR